jgi:dTDP-4-amino-4,6-dideoxygalactose transaminase
MRVPFVDLKTQYQNIKEEVMSEIGQALDGMQLFLGKNVKTLEEEYARFCTTSDAIGVGSGTDALHIALRAYGIGQGDEVITVAHTFIATTEAIILAGAKPVFVDIDPDTYTMDVSQVEKMINGNTKAILPVHLYGQPADMDPILELARKYNLKVIEDSCQAHGAEYKGRRAGSLGDAGCFSFYFSKNLGAYGESGIITTSDAEFAARCRMIRDHGSSQKYQHSMIGFNGRLDEIQAAVLRIKLSHLDTWTENRRKLAGMYNENLPDEFITPKEESWAKHVYHLYVIRTPERDRLKEWFDGKGIGCGMHYPIPVHMQEAWRNYGGEEYSLPVTEKITGEILSLPIYPEMSDEEIDYVCESVKEYCGTRVESR